MDFFFEENVNGQRRKSIPFDIARGEQEDGGDHRPPRVPHLRAARFDDDEIFYSLSNRRKLRSVREEHRN